MLSSFSFDAFDRLATEQFDDLLGERRKMIGKFLILQIADELGLVGIVANLLPPPKVLSLASGPVTDRESHFSWRTLDTLGRLFSRLPKRWSCRSHSDL
jgi:hypothetical protein